MVLGKRIEDAYSCFKNQRLVCRDAPKKVAHARVCSRPFAALAHDVGINQVHRAYTYLPCAQNPRRSRHSASLPMLEQTSCAAYARVPISGSPVLCLGPAAMSHRPLFECLDDRTIKITDNQFGHFD
jgi:hypothetical protein